MKFYNKNPRNPTTYSTVIASAENSAGNESVGNTWIDTRAFPKETPVETIIAWAKENGCGGRLTITIDESSVQGTREETLG